MLWYFFAGKLVTFISYFSFYNLIVYDKNLSLLCRMNGWIFIEHIFEEYNKTSGKFFLINKDFRSLITNLLLINRNVLFWSQLLTLIEFLFYIFFLGLLFYCLIYLILKDQKKGKRSNLLILTYYMSIIYIIFLKIIICINLFDIYSIFKYAILFCFTYLIIGFIYFKIIIVYNDLLYNLKFVRTYFYYLIFWFLYLSHFKILFMLSMNNNNFIQEFFIQILLPYLYLYNFIF